MKVIMAWVDFLPPIFEIDFFFSIFFPPELS
jgi:hypothetical protein